MIILYYITLNIYHIMSYHIILYYIINIYSFHIQMGHNVVFTHLPYSWIVPPSGKNDFETPSHPPTG